MKVPGPAAGYTDLVDYCLDQQVDEGKRFPLSPSAANKCSRALTYELIEYAGLGSFPKPKIEPQLKRLFALGHSVEWQVIKNLDLIPKLNPKYRVRFKQQVLPLFTLPAVGSLPERLIEGQLDLAVINEEGDSGFLDVKSAKDKFHAAFKTYWDGSIDKFQGMTSLVPIEGSSQAFYANDLQAFLEELNDQYFEDNFIQLNLYSCSDTAKLYKVSHGAIYRYNKNDSRHVEIRFKPSDDLFHKIATKFGRIYSDVGAYGASVTKGMRCEWPVGTIKHAFCPCHTYAQESADDALKAWFKTFPKKEWPVKEKELSPEAQEYAANLEQYIIFAQMAEEIEQKLAKHLSEARISKIELANGNVYELKSYKTGGPGGGPRLALKRSKK